MGTTEAQYTTETKLKRIAWLSSEDRYKQFNCLMHLFNKESLTKCFYELNRNKAVGVDGVTKAEYGNNLEANIEDLLDRMKGMAYKPGPIRQKSIPKEGQPGKTRELGISNLEDKIVQKMTQKVLESIYEPIFLNCSYGFRIRIGCHDAIRALHKNLFRNNVQTVIDLDIENFFGSIKHKTLEDILRDKIKDVKFMRYIIRMFKSGVLTNGELTVSEEGVAQGSCTSPILANIFAHHVLDKWFENTVKSHCKGKVEMFRYCDDICINCESSNDARRIEAAIAKRLGKYGLKVNKEKTKLVCFSRHAGKKGSFDFLGFTFYWGFSRKGHRIPKVKTSGKRMRAKLKRANEWARRIRNALPLKEIWKRLRIKIMGHIRYFGVSFNIKRVRTFIDKVGKIMFKWLNRRSQRKSFNWEKFAKYLKANPLPNARIYHVLF